MGLPYVAARERLHGIVEDVMRLQLHCHSDIDLSHPAMQVEIRSHIARCLRDYPHGGEGVITLGGQLRFFDADKRLEALSARDDPLEAIDRLVPWESFRAEVEAVVLTSDELKSSLQALNNLSDDQMML